MLERVPKLIYWNLVPSENIIDTRNKILKQFFEIGDNLKNTNYLKIDSNDDPTNFYKQHGIDVILLIDQFNFLVNLNKRCKKSALYLSNP